MEKDKPYTLDDLHKAMGMRKYFLDQLEEKHREIKVERGKLDSLENDEAKLSRQLKDQEAIIKRMLGNIE